MWSNLNDSFSALTGHISTLRQSIPAMLTESDRIRELEIRTEILQNEVARHEHISHRYRDRWLKAKEAAEASGQWCEIYCDDLDQLERAREQEASSGDGQPEASVGRCTESVVLDSATQRILSLEDELRKVEADREHWQVLAKQKTSSAEELSECRSRLQIFAEETKLAEQRYAELQAANEELSNELQTLDAQHEEALARVIGARDLLQDRNKWLESRIGQLESGQCRPTLSDADSQTECAPAPDPHSLHSLLDSRLAQSEEDISVQRKVEIVLSESERRVNCLEAELKSLREQRAEEESRTIAELTSRLESLLRQNEDLQCEVENGKHDTPKPPGGNPDMALTREEPEGATVDVTVSPEQIEGIEEGRGPEEGALSKLSALYHHLKCDFEQSCSEKGAVEQQLTAIRQELLSSEESLRECRAQLQQTCEERDELLTQTDQLRRDLQIEASRVVELERRGQCLQQEATSKEQELLSVGAKLAQVESSVKSSCQHEFQAVLEHKDCEIEKRGLELERLRERLLQVEDNYTSEFMLLESELREKEEQLLQLEQVKAREQGLEEQIRNALTQRDKARNEASMLEDRVQQYSISISNLQAVIEQLEREHGRKAMATEAQHRKALEAEGKRTEEAFQKLQSQEVRLRETLEALEAASRLSEIVDQKEDTISHLKRDLTRKQERIEQLTKQVDALKCSYDGKVDKQIVKNLLISYFASPHDKKSEGERLLARFLDFNQQEMTRSGIRIGREARPALDDSFTSKFVHFLEAESQVASSPSESAESSGHCQTAELARDLNKRLDVSNTSALSGKRLPVNPFVSHPPASARSASRTSSRHSSIESLVSQGPTPPSLPLNPLFASVRDPESTSTQSHISAIVQDAVETEKYI